MQRKYNGLHTETFPRGYFYMVFFWTCFIFGAYDCRGDRYGIWGALMSLGMQKHVLFSVNIMLTKSVGMPVVGLCLSCMH